MGAVCSGQNRATAQPRNSAGSCFAKNQAPSVAVGVSASSSFFDSQLSTIRFTDTAAMPPAGQSALWKYKVIYIQADQRVGQWSDVVSIPVAG
jgi:hypothetical protein